MRMRLMTRKQRRKCRQRDSCDWSRWPYAFRYREERQVEKVKPRDEAEDSMDEYVDPFMYYDEVDLF